MHRKGIQWVNVVLSLWYHNKLSYRILLSLVNTVALSSGDAFSVFIQHFSFRAKTAFSARLTLGSLAGTCGIATTLFVNLSYSGTVFLWWHKDKKMKWTMAWHPTQLCSRTRCVDGLAEVKNALKAGWAVHLRKIRFNLERSTRKAVISK